MTTFRYRLTLNDREIFVLQDALRHYRAHCETPAAPCPPLSSNRPLRVVDAILDQLFLDTEMTSTSTHCSPSAED